MKKNCFLLLVLFFMTACSSTALPLENNNSWYKPTSKTSWQMQLEKKVNPNYDVDVYIIDLYDSSKKLIQSIQSKNKKVICYFSAGSFEDWRVDAKDFPKEILGENLDGWEGERWLDIRSSKLYVIMKKRLDLAKEKGCDGVDPDNVDGYTNKTGFPLVYEDQIAYNMFIAKEAHKRGLAVGLKNDLDQIEDLVDFYDFTVNEQCFEYEECDVLAAFTQQNKPVFNVEYTLSHMKQCQQSRKLDLRTLVLPLELDDSFRNSCDAKK